MSLLLETICIEGHQVQNWSGHARRMERSLAAEGWELDLGEVRQRIHEDYRSFCQKAGGSAGRVKCRLVYSSRIESLSFLSYELPRIQTLQMVEATLTYPRKYADRQVLDDLRASSRADDVLIVQEDRIKDTTFCNVAFREGERWLTPALPLLEGTRRERLLETGLLTGVDLFRLDLMNFSQIMLFNAMIAPFEIVLPWPDCLTRE